MENKDKNIETILYKYTKFTDDKIGIVADASTGVYANAVYDLTKVSNYKKDFFAGILNISSKTLDRYGKSKKRLSPLNSEQVIKLFYLYKKGLDVFGSIESFNKWMERSSYGLSGYIPLKLLSTLSGIDLITEELSKIEYGDFA